MKKHPTNIETRMLYGKTQTMGIVRASLDIDEALELIIDLASQNIVDRYDNPAEYRRQMAALRLVQETFNRGDRL